MNDNERKWRFVRRFEITITVCIWAILFLALVVVVQKLPFRSDIQTAILGFSFALFGYLITQYRKEVAGRRAIASGIREELYRLQRLLYKLGTPSQSQPA